MTQIKCNLKKSLFFLPQGSQRITQRTQGFAFAPFASLREITTETYSQSQIPNLQSQISNSLHLDIGHSLLDIGYSPSARRDAVALPFRHSAIPSFPLRLCVSARTSPSHCPKRILLGHWTFLVGYWIFISARRDAVALPFRHSAIPPFRHSVIPSFPLRLCVSARTSPSHCPKRIPLGHWTFLVGYWTFPFG